MAMADRTARRLRATTTARKWRGEVDTSPLQDGSDWRPIMGQTDMTVNPGTATMQDDSDYDSGGYGSQSATGLTWGFTATVRRAPQLADGTKYDDGQEWLRGKGMSTGTDNTAHVRLYEYNGPNGPLVEAYEGYAGIAWANNGGAQDALSTATITGTGQGVLVPIPHPAGSGATAPIVSSLAIDNAAASVAAAGGTLVTVRGSGFATATAVVIGGNPVPDPDRIVVGDGILVVRVPAHAAGQVDVVVTNPGGTSGTSGATKLTYA